MLEGVDCDLVEDDSLLQQQEADVHQTIAGRPEDVPLFGEVPEFSAGVHDEDDDFLLVHIALSGLVDDSLLLLLGLVYVLAVDVLHVQLDVQRVHELDFLGAVAGFVFVKQLGHFVLCVPEHYRSRTSQNSSSPKLTVSCRPEG